MRCEGALGLVLVGVLSACQAARPAADPATDTSKPASKQPAPKSSGSDFAPDAMEAMAVLASFWAMLGPSSDARETPSGWHRHAASGTCMPKGSRSWELGKVQTYAPDDESVTLWNDGLKIALTLYTYPPTKPLEPEFQDAVAAMSKACTEGPVMTTKLGDGHVGACVHRLQPAGLVIEQVLVLQRGKWSHKARFTFPAKSSEAYVAGLSVVGRAFAACAAGGT